MEQLNPELIRPAYVKDLPENIVNVSDIIDRKITVDFKESTNEVIKGFEAQPVVFYSPAANEFYVRKTTGDVVSYKILRWRTQKAQGHEYQYVLIPYKRKKPIKILQRTWNRIINPTPTN
jgi:hypothetical protein